MADEAQESRKIKRAWASRQTPFHRLALRLLLLPRASKRFLQECVDATLIVISLYLAAVLRVESLDIVLNRGVLVAALIAVPTAVAIFARRGLYLSITRYLGVGAIYSIVWGCASAAILVGFAAHLFQLSIPRSLPPLFALVATGALGASRMVAQHLFASLGVGEHRRRVAIYGAGSAGRQLANSLMHSRDWMPVLFFDDDASLHQSVIFGLPVMNPAGLASVVADNQIEQVLFAIPSASRAVRSTILERVQDANVAVLTVPSIDDLACGRLGIDSLQKIDIADLLEREPVPPMRELFESDIKGKVVLVTGAGGSIGGELCRQIVRLSPAHLVLFEISEYALYSIHAELEHQCREDGEKVEISALLGSTTDRRRLAAVFGRFRINTVYHAAAYKHVPLVERNLSEGVTNNTIGTMSTALAAVAGKVDSFVLISTDKAVRPTNAMGASKRVAELICQALAHEEVHTRFSIVRFGNVLGSSGSVVPLFREQIRRGGPVTVTHRDVVRYFMTIPEAAQLVMQAGAMGRSGEIFLLDMGAPVKIDDLARKMVRLSGLKVRDDAYPDGDIDITYIGLRPGEKLYEELLVGTSAVGTIHPKILTCTEESLPWDTLEHRIQELEAACRSGNYFRIREILVALPTHYAPERLWDYLGPAPAVAERPHVVRPMPDRNIVA